MNMFIRGTRVQTPTDKIDAAIANFQKQVIPNASKAPGYAGAALLLDRKTGSGIGVTYWETAKAMSEAEQVGIKTRIDAAKNVPGTQIINVERYEVVIMDRAQTPKSGTFARQNTLSGDPDKIDAATVFVRNKVLPVLKALKGYRATLMGVDRQTGRSVVSTVWDSLADLQASEDKIAGLRKEAGQTAGAKDVQVEVFESAVVELTATAAAVTSKS
jgi:heme-degrading monooxygenase HmoA